MALTLIQWLFPSWPTDAELSALMRRENEITPPEWQKILCYDIVLLKVVKYGRLVRAANQLKEARPIHFPVFCEIEYQACDVVSKIPTCPSARTNVTFLFPAPEVNPSINNRTYLADPALIPGGPGFDINKLYYAAVTKIPLPWLGNLGLNWYEKPFGEN